MSLNETAINMKCVAATTATLNHTHNPSLNPSPIQNSLESTCLIQIHHLFHSSYVPPIHEHLQHAHTFPQ